MTINERISFIIQEKNLNPNSFSNEIGVNSTVIHNILKGRNKPSYDVLLKIISTFDDINIDWFMTGNGNIFKVDSRMVLDRYLNEVNSILIKLNKMYQAFDVLKVSGAWDCYPQEWTKAHSEYENFEVELRDHLKTNYENKSENLKFYSKLQNFFTPFSDEYFYRSSLLAALVINPKLKNKSEEFLKFIPKKLQLEGVHKVAKMKKKNN